MQYKAKGEEELNQFTIFEEGEYSFRVVEATNQISQAGNEQIKLKLALFDDNDRRGGAYDYLLEAMLFKIKHFCEATGLDYENEYLDASMCLNKTGRCKVKKEEYKEKWQNKIEDYCKDEQAAFVENCKADAEEELF